MLSSDLHYLSASPRGYQCFIFGLSRWLRPRAMSYSILQFPSFFLLFSMPRWLRPRTACYSIAVLSVGFLTFKPVPVVACSRRLL